MGPHWTVLKLHIQVYPFKGSPKIPHLQFWVGCCPTALCRTDGCCSHGCHTPLQVQLLWETLLQHSQVGDTNHHLFEKKEIISYAAPIVFFCASKLLVPLSIPWAPGSFEESAMIFPRINAHKKSWFGTGL